MRSCDIIYKEAEDIVVFKLQAGTKLCNDVGGMKHSALAQNAICVET